MTDPTHKGEDGDAKGDDGDDKGDDGEDEERAVARLQTLDDGGVRPVHLVVLLGSHCCWV